MRIIDLAQQFKATPRDVLQQAVGMGLEVRTILSRLDDEDLAQLQQGFKRPASFEVADEELRLRGLAARKHEAVVAQIEAARGSEALALQAAIDRAREIEAAVSAPTTAVEAAQEPTAAATAEAAVTTSEAETPAEAPAAVESADESADDEPVATPAVPAKPKRHPARAFHEADGDDEDLVEQPRRAPARPREAPKSARRPDPASTRRAGAAARPAAEPKAAAPAAAPVAPESKTVSFRGGVIIKDLAAKLGVRPNIIITELMRKGVLASINQKIDATTATRIAESHGFTVEEDRTRRKADNRPVLRKADADDAIPQDDPEELQPRPPVVTFLGHVDHGKTSLMDRIRSASVASGEAGGITQHIGSYTVDVSGHPITFLDTPGHAAFSSMRARGASLTDIAVIIIAADDGIMPQTREAIRHARDADVALMVAVNKIDLPQARPDRVLQQLQAESLTPEEWGGDVVVCNVSAETGEGIDHLLEMILLQAELLELRANPKRRANGTVVEAQMEPGRGPTASVLVTGGTLKTGDTVLCGEHYGRLRAIMNCHGNLIKSAGPSMAVRLMGLSGVPEAGCEFRVMTNEKRAKQLAAAYAEGRKEESLGVTQARSVDDIFRKLQDAEKYELRVILRADVQGSVEAIEDSIAAIQSEKASCSVIQSGTGNITANDVQRAGSGSALIIGFHVTPEPGVNAEARHYGVRIKTFRVIYELLDFIKQEMLNLLPVEHREVVRGHALTKQVFSLTRKGNVAGCVVQDGVMLINGKVRILRKQQVVHSGTFLSIRHFQDEVKEVTAGQECGLRLVNFEDYQEGDILECFVLEEQPKTL